jgi:hypothetical protein
MVILSLDRLLLPSVNNCEQEDSTTHLLAIFFSSSFNFVF